MAPRDEWFGHYERMKFEAKDYAQRAKFQRSLAMACRRKRDWLGALTADDRAREYRRTRDERIAEAKKIKLQWGFR